MNKLFNGSTQMKNFSKTNTEQTYKLSHAPQFKNADQFIKAKLRILENDFCIHPTETEIEHLNDIARESEIKGWDDRKTEAAINCAVRQIIIDN